MGSAYQIQDQGGLYFFTFQVVGWADIFSRQVYRDIIMESLDYCRGNKGMELFAYITVTNRVHCILRSKEEKLSDLMSDFKKHTSKKVLFEVAHNR